MWKGIGQLLSGLVTGLVSSILGYFRQKKLKREASRGRAAKEFLKSEDEAKAEEDKQRELQDEIKKDGVELDKDDLFNLDDPS